MAVTYQMLHAAKSICRQMAVAGIALMAVIGCALFVLEPSPAETAQWQMVAIGAWGVVFAARVGVAAARDRSRPFAVMASTLAAPAAGFLAAGVYWIGWM